MNIKRFAAVAALASSVAFAAPAHAVPVDVELQLLVDVSGSVNDNEFLLQRDGYADAFRDAGIIAGIESGAIGSVAVQLIYWSSTNSQAVAVDWALIDDAASSNIFADMVTAAARPFEGGTQPDDAIVFGTPLFDNNGFEGTRQVMDVSGDGSGSPSATSAARDAALAAGVDTINGLVIGSQNVENFYIANIAGGAGGFVIRVETFDDFAEAVRTKIGREIVVNEVPIPGAVVLMATGIMLLRRQAGKRKAA